MRLRDLLITAIVVGALPYVLRHPWIGVLLWTWLSIMNPHKLAWGFATHAPFAAAAVKSASRKVVECPGAEEMGSQRRTPPPRMSVRIENARTLGGLK